ncbi:hypothetical protein GGR55DRAFT_455115 [Xylaria sp. FL0064]|nr:hypothetical protein GGR55DRAFT_455115 [Xylaria sp. FL0064]
MFVLLILFYCNSINAPSKVSIPRTTLPRNVPIPSNITPLPSHLRELHLCSALRVKNTSHRARSSLTLISKSSLHNRRYNSVSIQCAWNSNAGYKRVLCAGH